MRQVHEQVQDRKISKCILLPWIVILTKSIALKFWLKYAYINFGSYNINICISNCQLSRDTLSLPFLIL